MKILKQPGTWLGMVAVVFAMSGSAYAAAKITGAQVKDGTITGKDIKRGSISPANLSSAVGTRGPAGPAGATGLTGPAGAQGPAGPTVVGKLTPTTVDFSVPGGTVSGVSVKMVTVACPAGQRVVSGGWFMSNGIAFADKTYDGASWSVGVDNYGSSSAATGQLTALCAPAGVAVASSANKHAARDAKITKDVSRYRASMSKR